MALLLLLPGLASAGANTSNTTNTITLGSIHGAHTLGPVEVIYDWWRDHCMDGLEPSDWDVPDMPARMWRRANNETTLISSVNLGSRANIGPDPNHLEHSCELYYNNTCGNQEYGDSTCTTGRYSVCCDPSKWADREWIFSPWIFPENDTVVALAHMEFHPQNDTARTSCSVLSGGGCWFNAITAFNSHDGGRSWSHMRPAPNHLVAAQPYQMPPGGPGPGNKKMPMGYEAPSNIVQHPTDGFYYAIMQTWSYGAQQSNSTWSAQYKTGFTGSGNCFIRTRDLTDPTSWRGWNGRKNQWSVAFVDPYNDPPASFDPADHVCTPALNLGYPSLLWSTFYNKFMAVGSSVWDCSLIVFALSDDLVTWSEPYPLYQPECKSTCGGAACKPGDIFYQEIYPSLMDPASPSHNYDVAGGFPYLYFITFRPTITSPSGKITVVRDIVRRPLQLY